MLHKLFAPSCPCDAAAKGWVEQRLLWLMEEFEENAFTGRPVVLPTPEFFPDPYRPTEAAARALLERVCGYMDVPFELVELGFDDHPQGLWLVNDKGKDLPFAAGTFEFGQDRYLIHLDHVELDNPIGLVGTIAHELAHARLLGEGRIPWDVYDNELLTDLTVVFFGLGIFAAHGPRNWDSMYATWPGTDLRKPEYMTAPMYGYALAHLAWFQSQQRPAWAKYLSRHARFDFHQASRFLFRTGQSALRPQGL